MPLFGSPPPPPPPFSYAQCYADFLTNALGEPSVLRAFLLTVGVATFVALPLIAILNADKVVKPDKPIIHKHPLFNPAAHAVVAAEGQDHLRVSELEDEALALTYR